MRRSGSSCKCSANWVTCDDGTLLLYVVKATITRPRDGRHLFIAMSDSGAVAASGQPSQSSFFIEAPNNNNNNNNREWSPYPRIREPLCRRPPPSCARSALAAAPPASTTPRCPSGAPDRRCRGCRLIGRTGRRRWRCSWSRPATEVPSVKELGEEENGGARAR